MDRLLWDFDQEGGEERTDAGREGDEKERMKQETEMDSQQPTGEQSTHTAHVQRTHLSSLTQYPPTAERQGVELVSAQT